MKLILRTIISMLLIASLAACDSVDEPSTPVTKNHALKDDALSTFTRSGGIEPQAIEWETVVHNGTVQVGTLKNQKVIMGSMASNGSYGVYICDVATVWIEIDVPDPDAMILRGVNDNRCGYLPSTVSNATVTRGTYIDTNQPAGSKKQKVATTCYRIITNMAGYNYPKNYWRPCAPEDVKLVYKVGR